MSVPPSFPVFRATFYEVISSFDFNVIYQLESFHSSSSPFPSIFRSIALVIRQSLLIVSSSFFFSHQFSVHHQVSSSSFFVYFLTPSFLLRIFLTFPLASSYLSNSLVSSFSTSTFPVQLSIKQHA